MENKRQQANEKLKDTFNFTSVPVNEITPLPNYNNLEYENIEESNSNTPTVINNNVSVNLNVNQQVGKNKKPETLKNDVYKLINSSNFISKNNTFNTNELKKNYTINSNIIENPKTYDLTGIRPIEKFSTINSRDIKNTNFENLTLTSNTNRFTNQNTSNFDISDATKITIMSDQQGLPKFDNENVSNIDMSDVTKMTLMADRQDLPKFDNENVSNFDISDATKITIMSDQQGLPQINNQNTSNIDMSDMNRITIMSDQQGLPKFDNQNTSNFDISDATKMTLMTDQKGLPQINNQNTSNFDMSDVTKITIMSDQQGLPKFDNQNTSNFDISDATKITIMPTSKSEQIVNKFFDQTKNINNQSDATINSVSTNSNNIPSLETNFYSNNYQQNDNFSSYSNYTLDQSKALNSVSYKSYDKTIKSNYNKNLSKLNEFVSYDTRTNISIDDLKVKPPSATNLERLIKGEYSGTDPNIFTDDLIKHEILQANSNLEQTRNMQNDNLYSDITDDENAFLDTFSNLSELNNVNENTPIIFFQKMNSPPIWRTVLG